MKRIVTLLLALILVSLVLVACTEPEKAEDTTSPDVTTDTPDITTEPVVDGRGTFTLRIEGNFANLYYGPVAIGDSNNLKDLLAEFDKVNSKINIEGEENAYITKINTEAGGTYGGWDGWCVLVNGESPAVGIGDIMINEGDEVVLYYGDPWGVGMAYPEYELEGTRLLFYTSTALSPAGTVAYIKVTIDGVEYHSDENGMITLEKPLAPGDHTMQIELKAENGLCLALRYAPDFTFST